VRASPDCRPRAAVPGRSGNERSIGRRSHPLHSARPTLLRPETGALRLVEPPSTWRCTKAIHGTPRQLSYASFPLRGQNHALERSAANAGLQLRRPGFGVATNEPPYMLPTVLLLLISVFPIESRAPAGAGPSRIHADGRTRDTRKHRRKPHSQPTALNHRKVTRRGTLLGLLQSAITTGLLFVWFVYFVVRPHRSG